VPENTREIFFISQEMNPVTREMKLKKPESKIKKSQHETCYKRDEIKKTGK
jgi:hypothetical protein